MMRRPGIVGLDAFHFHGFQYAGLALHLFLQHLDKLTLFGQHFIQLLHLMLQMREMRLEFFQALGNFVGHGKHFAAIFRKVEPATETDWLFVRFVYFVV